MSFQAATPRLFGAFQPWADVWYRSGWRVQRHFRTGEARLLSPSGDVARTGLEDECVAHAIRGVPGTRRSRAALLMHGLAHHPGAMHRIEAALLEAGWAVANIGYPSVRLPLERHAEAASRVARGLQEDGAREIALVGHSLGGLIVRAAATRAAADGWTAGRMVLVGSPARGAAIARALQGFGIYKTVFGPCGQTVTPDGATAVPVPSCRGIGIVAGGTGGRGFNPFLDGDNDGIVTVAETRLPGAEDGFHLVRALHTPLATNQETVTTTVSFLEIGRMAA